MQKKLTLCCVMTAMLFLAGNVLAQNPDAYFLLDTNLATKGFQTSKPSVTNIGATKEVGFAIYGLGLTDVAAYTITFDWDGTKATFRNTKSNCDIIDDPITINGGTTAITPPVETGVLGSSPLKAGEENTAGHYSISFARAGTGTTAATALLYFGVFRTVDTFKTTDQLDVTVTIQMADSTGRARSLGARHFTVNGVDVKSATWGEVKNQFKNF